MPDWNYLQVEISDGVLFPVVGPGGLTREAAHAFIRRLLVRHDETVSQSLEPLIQAWDAGAADDTVYVGSLVWAIYEAADSAAGAREWVEDLAATLRRSGSKVRIAW
ncbi:hypothetical protein ACH3VR_21705 [Microbacterium sp. B2969]|uniref:Uncharacterized protein n=1 Tax=Microbacterium alkaliflavum TaxID=3248839 RepID=A0ABW7QFL5_9MICO